MIHLCLVCGADVARVMLKLLMIREGAY